MLNKPVLDFDKKTKDLTKWRAKVNTDGELPVVEIQKKCNHHGDVGEIYIEVMLGADPTSKMEEGYVIIRTKGIAKLSILEASDLAVVLSEASRAWMMAKEGATHGPDSNGGVRYE